MRIVPGLGVYWRGHDVLQIGLDPRVGVLVEGLSTQEQELVTFLTRPRTAPELEPLAQSKGVEPTRLAEILVMLDRAGVLEGLPSTFPAPDSRRPGGEGFLAGASSGTANSLRLVRTSIERTSRSSHHVHINRLDPLGTEICLKLAAHGVGTVSFSDSTLVNGTDHSLLWPRWHGLPREQALTTVLRQFSPNTLLHAETPPNVEVFTGSRLILPVTTQRCLDDDVPHLLAWTEEVDVCVGPLVEPERSPCAGCLHQARLASDPAWPILAPQAEASHPLNAAGETRDLAASIAVRSILAFLDDLGNPLRDSQWRVPPLPSFPRFVSISRHPRCGCSSHEAMLNALNGANGVLSGP